MSNVGPILATERRASFNEKCNNLTGMAFAAILMMGGGLVLLLIPVIGWILGPMFLIVGVIAFFGSPILLCVRSQILEGTCPYCAQPLSAAKSEKAITCKVCKSRVIIRAAYFCPIGVSPPTEQSADMP